MKSIPMSKTLQIKHLVNDITKSIKDNPLGIKGQEINECCINIFAQCIRIEQILEESKE